MVRLRRLLAIERLSHGHAWRSSVHGAGPSEEFATERNSSGSLPSKALVGFTNVRADGGRNGLDAERRFGAPYGCHGEPRLRSISPRLREHSAMSPRRPSVLEAGQQVACGSSSDLRDPIAQNRGNCARSLPGMRSWQSCLWFLIFLWEGSMS